MSYACTRQSNVQSISPTWQYQLQLDTEEVQLFIHRQSKMYNNSLTFIKSNTCQLTRVDRFSIITRYCVRSGGSGLLNKHKTKLCKTKQTLHIELNEITLYLWQF